MIKISYSDLAKSFNRRLSIRPSAYFGIDLVALVERENTGFEVPVLVKRLIEEIERRGVDGNGIYVLCGSAIKKQELKNEAEKDPMMVDLAPAAVPDINVLTGIIFWLIWEIL